MGKEPKPIPWWVSALFVVVCTSAAFWFFGGQHYLAHRAEIEYSLFTHEDEAQDPLRWLIWLFQTGTVSALIGFIISASLVKVVNDRAKKANQLVKRCGEDQAPL
jgi:succinate dehydrogenase/fumarate reductase cytochrome b subunit